MHFVLENKRRVPRHPAWWMLPGLFAIMAIFPYFVQAQKTWENIPRLLTEPEKYVIVKADVPITIDGRADEKIWSQAGKMVFGDIVSGQVRGGNTPTVAKLLWDDQNLYIYAFFPESNIWASVTKHDTPVFQDNAFEVFFNPDATTFNYFEFQINALSTVWDLFLPRPYRSGGAGLSSWDIKGLQKAVHIAGTLNNPSDKDTGWGVELAIPFSSLNVRNTANIPGAIWRMNLSRVQWETEVVNGTYQRKKDPATGWFYPEKYAVWSPVGIVDLHYPERWGYVIFSNTNSPAGIAVPNARIDTELRLWKYYYLQQMYAKDHGEFTGDLNLLDSIARAKFPTMQIRGGEPLQVYADKKQFWIQAPLSGTAGAIAVDNEGELHFIKDSK